MRDPLASTLTGTVRDADLHLAVAVPARRTVCGVRSEIHLEDDPEAHRTSSSWEWSAQDAHHSYVRTPCIHRGGVTRRRPSRRRF